MSGTNPDGLDKKLPNYVKKKEHHDPIHYNPKYNKKYTYKGSDNQLRVDNERNELLSQLIFEIRELNFIIREYIFTEK